MQLTRDAVLIIALTTTFVPAIGCRHSERMFCPSSPEVATPKINTQKAAEKATVYIECRPPQKLRHLFIEATNKLNSLQLRTVMQEYATSEVRGSGFVYLADQQDYSMVVTNKHVVLGTEKPLVSLDQGRSFYNSEIMFIDADYDLAVLEIPKQPFGLSLKEGYSNGEAVESYGFPSLINTGSFQISNGIISNSCVKESILMNNGSDNCWIQHTSAIDPGSSGGPLILKDGDKYLVAGVNTLLIKERNAFFAVPANIINNVIAKAVEVADKKSDNQWMAENLKQSCHEFVSDFSSSSPSIMRTINAFSNDMIADRGLIAFLSHDNEDIDEVFVRNPYLGMQGSIAYFLAHLFNRHGYISAQESCNNINPSDLKRITRTNQVVRIITSMSDGSRLELMWIFERGTWRLKNYNLMPV